MKYLLLLPFIAINLASCGGDSSDDTASSKSLFSVWNEVNTTIVLDYTNGKFDDSFPFSFQYADDSQCNCELTFIGSQSAGSYTLNSCVYEANSGPSNTDPGCNAANNTGTYTNSSNVLVTTSSTGDVSTYK
jgi:hypothetical protein